MGEPTGGYLDWRMVSLMDLSSIGKWSLSHKSGWVDHVLDGAIEGNRKLSQLQRGYRKWNVQKFIPIDGQFTDAWLC